MDADRDAQRAEARRYWDAHPIATDSVEHDKGSIESFDAIFARWERDMDPRRRAFLDQCRGKSLLEVGCGIAIDGRYLASHGVAYYAVDYSRESLRLARMHFEQKGLPPRFTHADATQLPFPSDTFDVVYSIGVLHHVPDMKAACREVERVVKPGGDVRVMFYNRHSYHHALVKYVIAPSVWALLRMPFGDRLARLGPEKLGHTFEICKQHGFDVERILSASTDTSTAGEGNFNPLSYFVAESDLPELFPDLEHFQVYRTVLKYFPIPWLRRAVEKRWGFFLAVHARKPA